MYRITPLLALLFVLPLTACADDDEVVLDEPTAVEPAPMDPGAIPDRTTVAVGLTDFEIAMPQSVPAGPTTFVIENEGSVEHSFEVEGQGMEQVLATSLQPGGSATLDVTLAPGTYRVYCPIANHASRGMEMELRVVAEGASTAGSMEL